MILTAEQLAPFRQLAATLTAIDRPIYAEANQDWQQPILGGGDPTARIGFMGRDPGREEVIHQLPFIGAGGQKVRQTLYRFHHNRELPDFAASVAMGAGYYWLNTVPYKPIGNKAWSMAVKKQFQPLIAEQLLHHWQGERMITLGREAFFWFGLGQDRSVMSELEQFWQREDRFSALLTLDYRLQTTTRRLQLAPLPHPSPLNAIWYRRFPDLLLARLQQLS